ncbi:hypothetical protein ACWGDT_15840 [Streptomyces avermitilis]
MAGLGAGGTASAAPSTGHVQRPAGVEANDHSWGGDGRWVRYDDDRDRDKASHHHDR